MSELISKLTTELDMDESDIITVLRVIGLLHDSARRNEFNDLWDRESAQNCKNVLLEEGFSDFIAELFSAAMAYKDNPKAFTRFLKIKNIPESSWPSYHYLRMLIRLSDCFDIIRCVGQFQLQYTFSDIAMIPFLKQAELIEPFIDFAKKVHHIIYQCHQFYNINLFLIYLSRAKQYGLNLNELENAEIKNAASNFKLLYQAGYLLKILGKYIKINREKYLKEKIDWTIFESLQEISLSKILNKINQEHINLIEIFDNPDIESFEKIIDLICLGNQEVKDVFKITLDEQAHNQPFIHAGEIEFVSFFLKDDAIGTFLELSTHK
ncbi:MAG: hypothetical protein HKM04_10600, partial [Legionellales bacterium]|nr:hypothetical protein [Legionellales bacterium]